MTVAQLRNVLTLMSDDAVVVVAKDGEGNDFSPLSEVLTGLYRAETTWSGVLVHRYDEDEDRTGAVEAAVLWPVN